MPKAVYYYTRAMLIAEQQRINEVALQPTDKTVAADISFSTPLIPQGGSVDPTQTLQLTELVRFDSAAGTTRTTAIYNMFTDKGNLIFSIAFPANTWSVGDYFETYASYRSGDYASSQFPRITAEVLTDPAATRKYTIYY